MNLLKKEEKNVTLDNEENESENLNSKEANIKDSFKIKFYKNKEYINVFLKNIKLKLKKVNNLKVFEKKRKVISFDIGSKDIKIAEGIYYKDELSIKKIVKLQTPANCIEDGDIINDEMLVSKVKDILKENSIKSKYAICTTNSTAIINREILIPLVEDEEIETVVAFEIQQYLPINLEEYILQYTVLNKLDKEDKMQVRVIIYPKRIAKKYYDFFYILKLKPYALDVNYNSLSKLVNYTNKIDEVEQDSDDFIVFIDIGSGSITINIFNKGILKFTKLIKAGESYLDSILKDILCLEVNEIESYKKHNIDLHEEKLKEQNIEVINEINRWISEIKKSLQIYKNNVIEINNIFIYGGGSKINGMDEYLTSKLFINTKCIKEIPDIILKNDRDEVRVNDFINAIGAIIRF